ncbi:transglutaminase domain-containing protein [Rufibacter roseus]|uniref:Transglutaminase domain-containing protein n=1 Tax=Rufibacter roseus TaxID=1567108 RepID=A0ABW2DHN5_9BACT|nr:transglutaminase domain-containing protein [Rufibacter roseus]
MRVLIYILLISVLPLQLAAQATSPFAQVDQKVLQIPAQETQTIEQLSAYINRHFQTPQDRVRAAYMWLANNVAYDVASLNGNMLLRKGQNFIDQTLRTRKALCQGYAEVFQELCNRAGVKAYFVGGYTKQFGQVDYLRHAWCAAQIDGKWYLFDPTWGAGFVQANKFVKKPTEKHFMVAPSDMIQSHYPFDPLWQFSLSPIKSKEFDAGISPATPRKPFFQFTDTLKAYEAEDDYRRLESTARRMEAHGAEHPFLAEHLQHLKQGVEIERYNAITNTYNQGIDLLNEFIHYKNNRLLSKKGEAEVKRILTSSVENLKSAKSQITAAQWKQRKDITSFAKNIDLALAHALSQETFIDNYFKASKAR